jgi:ferredoxin
MAWQLAEIETALDAAGLNLRGALSAARYDGLVPGAWRTPALLPDARTALVVGSGGRALWSALRAAPEFDAASDPVETYTARVLDALTGDLSRAGHPSRALYPMEQRGDAWADFVALAREAGLGASSRLGLLLHPIYGPWLSLRAVLLTAIECPTGAPLSGFEPCVGCAAPCAEACPGDAISPEGISARVCYETQRTEPACALRCNARRACVVGQEHAYAAEAEAHHMSA